MIQIGEYLDQKYLVREKIGQGGMSTVFLVRDNRLQKDWALKTIPKHGLENGEFIVQSLLSEVELLKKIDHPAIPRIIDVFEDRAHISIVLDLLVGQSLDKILKEKGSLSQKLSVQLGLQVCDALIYLHNLHAPIIYRDLKPSNLVVDENSKVHLIDFGVAREYKYENIEDTNCLGTRGYAAPEQYGGRGQTDMRTDVYSLGVTLYHMLTGHNPSNPPYEISPIRKKNPQLSRGLEKIIIKATKFNPEERYLNCKDFKKALENYREEDIAFKKAKQKKQSILFVLLFFFIFSTSSVFLNELQVSSTIKQDYIVIKKDMNRFVTKDNLAHFTNKLEKILQQIGL